MTQQPGNFCRADGLITQIHGFANPDKLAKDRYEALLEKLKKAKN